MTTEERIEKLERELTETKRRGRWLLALVGLVLAGLGLAWAMTKTTPAANAQGAAPGPKVIRANEFIVEDEKGNVRAKLMIYKFGPQLSLYDENGKSRVQLSLSTDGPMLSMIDENGKLRVGLSMLKDSPGTGLVLFDENQKGSLTLAVSKEAAEMALSDKSGKTIWKAPR